MSMLDMKESIKNKIMLLDIFLSEPSVLYKLPQAVRNNVNNIKESYDASRDYNELVSYYNYLGKVIDEVEKYDSMDNTFGTKKL